jgi:Holliday junction resolvase
MATPEAKVKAACVKVFKAQGVYYFFPVMNGMGRSGIPDIICCVAGRFLAVECKAGKNTTTALQDRELKAIADAGGVALVINENNLTMLADAIKEIKHGQ